jgi:AcrR family transcriptional regulator
LDVLKSYSECNNVTLAGTATSGEARVSLRERKKLATRRSLRRIALDLVAERGFVNVTVEDIAEAADVSPRTFFNYFPSKEAALFGADPERVAALRERIVHEAPGETGLEALRVVLVGEARALAEELVDLGGDPASWLKRMKAANVDPHLRAAQAAHLAMVERVVADGLTERLGADPEHDPYPALLAGAATGVMRAMTPFWARSGGAVPLDQLTDMAFQALAAGLPEHCTVRQITKTIQNPSASRRPNDRPPPRPASPVPLGRSGAHQGRTASSGSPASRKDNR